MLVASAKNIIILGKFCTSFFFVLYSLLFGVISDFTIEVCLAYYLLSRIVLETIIIACGAGNVVPMGAGTPWIKLCETSLEYAGISERH